tara:strand:- start:64 stop:351 length:288 start_codon:yes stop_codon:yes gene_type:complete
MALVESIEYDKIEVVTKLKYIQVRKATVITKDDVELSRTFERYTLECGTLDASNNLVETDISAQPVEVQAVCNAVWTDAVKLLQKNYLISQKQFS